MSRSVVQIGYEAYLLLLLLLCFCSAFLLECWDGYSVSTFFSSTIKGSRGLVVLTLDFESNNRRFDPGRDLKLSFALGRTFAT
jgi:hypothetical protein